MFNRQKAKIKHPDGVDRRRLRQRRLAVEPLESRAVFSANGFSPFIFGPWMAAVKANDIAGGLSLAPACRDSRGAQEDRDELQPPVILITVWAAAIP